MEAIVALALRPKRKTDLLDRLILGAGLMSLIVAVIGTLALGTPPQLAEDAPDTGAPKVLRTS
ncbi:hypothetical protein [Oceaniglobus roseus]|uniref:hypothetical protein n=1 Tax=Oceaniglobus roseus TaxID=1737570 RepID=UPI000C7F53F0|nr:hypothetical protein [Kandeliimicrobium roseum]